MSLFDQASLVVTPNGFKAGKLYSIKPVTGAGDLDVVRATSATRVNANGLIESVGNNIPRLDYSNGSCPSILVEPQATNLVLRSEEFDDAYWTKSGATVAISGTAPNGLPTANLVTEDTSNGDHRFFSSQTLTFGFTYTISVYLKSGNKQYVSINAQTWSGGDAVFDIINGLVSQQRNCIASIELVGNGWYRCSVIAVNSNSTGTFNTPVQGNQGATYNDSYIGTSETWLAWGAQIEAGSYATSYIPTVASTVTRNADAISKTGISSLIGQTEGTVFTDITITKPDSGNDDFLLIENGATPTDGVYVLFMNSSGQIGYFSFPSSAFGFISGVNYSDQRIKLAYTYSSDGLYVWINGNQVFSNGSVTLGTGLSTFGLNNPITKTLNAKVAETLIFKTRLTNTELATLTSL